VNNGADKTIFITASDLGQWEYCHYSWFNRVYRQEFIDKEKLDEQTKRGTYLHEDREKDGLKLKAFSQQRTNLLILFCILLMGALIWKSGLILIFALVAFFFLYILISKIRKKLRTTGDIESAEETLGTDIGNVLLTGRLDRVESINENSIIPVDYKSGKCPDVLYKTLKIQMYAYIYLLEKNCPDKMVPYGEILYEDGKKLLVENNENNRKFFHRTVEKISSIMTGPLEQTQKGLVDSLGRGHKSVNKCAKCASSEKCEYKLT
jgi:hypothetical protein